MAQAAGRAQASRPVGTGGCFGLNVVAPAAARTRVLCAMIVLTSTDGLVGFLSEAGRAVSGAGLAHHHTYLTAALEASTPPPSV